MTRPNKPRNDAEAFAAARRAGWDPADGDPPGEHGLFAPALRVVYLSHPFGALARVDRARLELAQVRADPDAFGWSGLAVGVPEAGPVVDVARQLAAALGQEGFAEGPGNDQPFGPWQGVANAAWCDSFAQWAAVHNGGYRWPDSSQFGYKGAAYCPYTENDAADLGFALYPMFEPVDVLPGWQVLFSWSRNDWCDHIGTIVRRLDNGNLLTIEGNYADSVALVERDWTYVRSLAALPAAESSDPDGPTGPPPPIQLEDTMALSHVTVPARKTLTIPSPPPKRSGGLPWAGVFFGLCAGNDATPSDDDYRVRVQINRNDGDVRGVPGQSEDGFVHLTGRRRFSVELGPGDESVTVYNPGGQVLVGMFEAAVAG